MSHLIILCDPDKKLTMIQIVKHYGTSMSFDSTEEAEEWAEECLGDTPYQIIDTADFKTTAERQQEDVCEMKKASL